MKKALLIRLDKIGDLVLTLPADRQRSLRDYECHWYISQGLGFIAEHANPPRKYREGKKSFSFSGAFKFYFFVRRLKPEISVSFHAPWWVNLVLKLAFVPIRIGVLSQWHSYLFLNRGIRQKRSRSEHHELEYNHLLVKNALKDESPTQFPYLPLTVSEERLVSDLPEQYGVVHPGMAGSALNWPLDHYAELVRKLTLEIPVIITGTKGDRFILEPLKDKLSLVPNIIWLDEKLNSQELLSVLKNARFVFAPSTGVIHLSASIGTPTFGVYSPVKVESAKRWGPRGDCVKIHTPNVNSIQSIDPSPTLDVMSLVTPQEIYDDISIQLKN